MKPISRKLQDLTLHHADIADWLKNEIPLEEIIVTLVAQKQTLMQKVMDLQAIAPKKIIGNNGEVFIWRCPEEFIPELDFAKGGFFDESS